MALADLERLDIAEIVYFTPAFFISIYICFKHGFWWRLILMLCAIRVAGSACDIAARQGASDPVGLEIASAVMNGIGSSFLIGASLGLVEILNRSMEYSHLPTRPLRYLQLIILAGIILSIVSGTKLSDIGQPSEISEGYDLLKAGTILFLVVYLAVCAIFGYMCTRFSQVQHDQRPLFYAIAIALPFLLVRIIYSLLQAFDSSSDLFNRYRPNVWTRAFMAIFEEFVIVGVYLAAAFKVPPLPKNKPDTTNATNLKDYAPGQNQGQGAPPPETYYRTNQAV